MPHDQHQDHTAPGTATDGPRGYQGSARYWADLRAKISQERQAQGLPADIEDDTTLDQLAAIVTAVLTRSK